MLSIPLAIRTLFQYLLISLIQHLLIVLIQYLLIVFHSLPYNKSDSLSADCQRFFSYNKVDSICAVVNTFLPLRRLTQYLLIFHDSLPYNNISLIQLIRTRFLTSIFKDVLLRIFLMCEMLLFLWLFCNWTSLTDIPSAVFKIFKLLIIVILSAFLIKSHIYGFKLVFKNCVCLFSNCQWLSYILKRVMCNIHESFV